MATVEPRPPVQLGEHAPSFTLRAINREGSVSLEDYRGKCATLVALFRGLH
jgi:peroxiredoxin